MTNPQTDTTPSQLVPINVAARWLRVPVKWLRDEAAAGRIPCLRRARRSSATSQRSRLRCSSAPSK